MIGGARQFAPRLALEEIEHAALDMFDTAGHAQNLLTAVTRLGPDRAALARPMHNLVRDMTQRQRRTDRKRRRLRQAAEARGAPGAMTLRKILRIGQIAARRHGQDGFAAARMDAQRVAPRAAMPAQLNRINRGADFDGKRARFGGAAIKEGAKSHVRRSEGEDNARILPYPPPGKSALAKTNHLPNISWGLGVPLPHQGVRNRDSLFIFIRNPGFPDPRFCLFDATQLKG